MKKLSFIIVTGLLSVLFSGVYCYGQQSYYSDSVITEDRRIEAGLSTLDLDTLHGLVPALFSKSYAVRAHAIQSMVEQCTAFYEQKFPDIKFGLQIMILDQKAWHKSHLEEYLPYGMPDAESLISKFFIGADEKAVGKLFGETDNLPDSVLSEFDCIALHELGHIFMIKIKNTYASQRWANEFLASYFAICFFEKHKNYPGLPQVGESGYHPPHRTLVDFDSFYNHVGARNYGWYQGQFQNLGYKLYPKFKVDLLRKFIANYAPDGKKLPPLVLLKQLAPKITNQWLKEMK